MRATGADYRVSHLALEFINGLGLNPGEVMGFTYDTALPGVLVKTRNRGNALSLGEVIYIPSEELPAFRGDAQ